MEKKKLLLRGLLVTLLLLMTIAASAQQMTKAKVRQAGVIVLSDKYVNPAGTKGNMIILRLNDKSRPKHKKNEIMIHEVCLATKVNQIHNCTIDKGELEIDKNGLIVWDDETNFSFNLDGENMTFIILNNNNSDGARRYKIENVLFYKLYIDMFTESPLGEEWDMVAAYQYIAEMFKPYQ